MAHYPSYRWPQQQHQGEPGFVLPLALLAGLVLSASSLSLLGVALAPTRPRPPSTAAARPTTAYTTWPNCLPMT